jgi:hypothetical protein
VAGGLNIEVRGIDDRGEAGSDGGQQQPIFAADDELAQACRPARLLCSRLGRFAGARGQWNFNDANQRSVQSSADGSRNGSKRVGGKIRRPVSSKNRQSAGLPKPDTRPAAVTRSRAGQKQPGL